MTTPPKKDARQVAKEQQETDRKFTEQLAADAEAAQKAPVSGTTKKSRRRRRGSSS